VGVAHYVRSILLGYTFRYGKEETMRRKKEGEERERKEGGERERRKEKKGKERNGTERNGKERNGKERKVLKLLAGNFYFRQPQPKEGRMGLPPFPSFLPSISFLPSFLHNMRTVLWLLLPDDKNRNCTFHGNRNCVFLPSFLPFPYY
jgi:hypothetical protein